MADAGPLNCHHCRGRLPLSALNRPGWFTCDRCGSRGAYWIFPAHYRADIHGKAAPARAAEQASCFFHPEKAAEVACDTCGRFLCVVCDIHVGQSHLCTTCLESETRPSSTTALVTERVLHDNVTLMLAAAAPIVFWPVTPLTAPYALYRGIRYFHAPSSIVGRTRWRLYLAMTLAVLEILGVAALVYVAVRQL